MPPKHNMRAVHGAMSKKRSRERPDVQRRDGAPARTGERIPADLSKQAANNSDSPPLYYDDRPFVCVDCGKDEIWTAKQQQWWYEVAKGSINSIAIRCRSCRQARRAKRTHVSDAHNQPIRNMGMLMRLIRAEIEPALMARGFVFEARNRPQRPTERVWIDYIREGWLFSIAFEKSVGLVAEFLDERGCRIVASSSFNAPRTRAEITATIHEFASRANAFIASLRPSA
ncbi:MAG: zinc-ribbon domain-containing protein [Planctomycetaceae bacterium]